MLTKKLMAIAMVSLFMLSSIVVFTPEEAEGQVIPDFTLVVNPGLITLDVAPGGNPTGQVSCTISNPTVHQETIRVTVSGAGITITPQIFVVTLAGGMDITVPIAVAAEPRSARRFISVTVMGDLERQNGAPPVVPYTTYAGFQVTISQYARVVMTVNEPFKKVRPGKENPVNLRIINDGNDRDKFQVTCTNKKELEDSGFSIVIVPTVTMDIDPQKYTEVKATIQTPKKFWVNEYYSMEFEAESKLQGTNEKVPMSMTLWVWGMYVPTFDPIFTIMAAAVIAVGLQGWIKNGDEEEEYDWQ